MTDGVGARAAGARRRDAAARRRADPVRRRVPADARPEGRPVPGGHRRRRAARACTATRPIRRPTSFPLALISPATEKTISSTLGELRERAAVLHIHPDDAAAAGHRAERRRCASSTRSASCTAPPTSPPTSAAARSSFSKGVWRKNTYNGSTSNALVPDSLTDLGARRVLQRRARPGRAARKTLSAGSQLEVQLQRQLSIPLVPSGEAVGAPLAPRI